MNAVLCLFATVIVAAMSAPVDDSVVSASARVLIKLHKLRQQGLVDDDLIHSACTAATAVLDSCIQSDNLVGVSCTIANEAKKLACGVAQTGIDFIKGAVGILG